VVLFDLIFSVYTNFVLKLNKREKINKTQQKTKTKTEEFGEKVKICNFSISITISH
jgi:uncharacterized membrane protein YqhA